LQASLLRPRSRRTLEANDIWKVSTEDIWFLCGVPANVLCVTLGMENESIVASFIYYYESENISESILAFKHAVAESGTHGLDDYFCTKALYGIDGCVPVLPGPLKRADSPDTLMNREDTPRKRSATFSRGAGVVSPFQTPIDTRSNPSTPKIP
jgi:hypothetical protein